ncbi:hypothetical protein ACFLT3_02015 [Chloroflexota bacterium]
MTTEKEVILEGAPDWYNTPLDELEFEWSPEERLEIERYCEKILKNIAEEEMTPLERWKAHMAGKPKDRKLMAVSHVVVYATRTLDSYAEAIKPIDVFRHPKLLVKAFLATVARYKLDYPNLHSIIYNDDLFGGKARMIESGQPVGVGDRPIKSMADLEGLEVPDPRRFGLNPGWLWAIREVRRFIDEYRLPIPVWTSLGTDPTCTAILGMMGWAPFLVAMRKEPELARRCSDLALQWDIKLAQALVEIARPDGMYISGFQGCFPLKGNEWVGDQLAELAKAVKTLAPHVHLSFGYSFLSGVFEWYDTFHEMGVMTPDTFDGGLGGLSEGIDMRRVFDFHREHNLWLSYSIRNETLEKGPISAIEEEIKTMSELGKLHPKFSPGIVPVYFVPPPHIDAAVAALKKYSK